MPWESSRNTGDIVKRRQGARRRSKIYIGDRDQLVALDGVRGTRDFLVT